MQVGSKNICVLIYGTVLDDLFSRLTDLNDLTETAVEEIDLQVKGPALHVLVEVIEIGIVIHILILGFPAVML